MQYSPASSTSSSSSSGSSIHPASLVDPATHSPALMQLIDIKLSKSVIDYVVDCVVETVDFAMGRTTSPSPSVSSRGRASSRFLAPFTSFVSTVLSRAEVTPPTLLVSLVYIHRARPHLSIALEEWALERVFLGALIAASKYTNDSTLKNVHWALCTGVFGKRDVGRIEREFLDVLDWELGVREADLLSHHQGLLAAAFVPVRTHKKTLSASSTSSAEYITIPSPSRHTHARRPSAGSIPELEPSSPYSHSSSSPHSSSSSVISLSPRTPAHEHIDVPMDVEAPSKAHAHGKFHDLLRSFPIPIPRHPPHQPARVGVH